MKKSERVEVGPECGRCKTTNRPSRSFCRVCGKHLKPAKPPKRKPLRTSSKTIARARASRSNAVAQMSARRQSQRGRRAQVVREVHLRDRGCQGKAAHAIAGVKCGGPLEVNELIPRAQWALGYLEPANCVLLCHNFHAWVTTHPTGAHALGFRLWAYEREKVRG